MIKYEPKKVIIAKHPHPRHQHRLEDFYHKIIKKHKHSEQKDKQITVADTEARERSKYVFKLKRNPLQKQQQ
ncbi:hypothetical protein OfM1_12080 [Lactovum odontotermitis]